MTTTGRAKQTAPSAGYYRFPTIHNDTVIFTSEGDLWQVPETGGTASRMTAGQGTARFPRISPDGHTVAFSGTEEGPMEVFVMPVSGGRPRRLTFHGVAALVCGWDRDGNILYASPAQQHTMRFTTIFRISPMGGEPEALPIGSALTLSYGPGGGMVLGRYGMVGREPAYWKRYRGGTAGDLWIDAKGSGEFRRLVELQGNLTHPLWVGDRIYFASDHEGVGNLYSTLPDGSDLLRHTNHEDYYVRHPSTDGQRIVYHAGADLFIYDPSTGETVPVEVEYPSPRTERNRKYVASARYLDEYAPHPQGHLLATVVRGKSYHMGLFEGPAIQHGEADGVRYRLAQWLPARKETREEGAAESTDGATSGDGEGKAGGYDGVGGNGGVGAGAPTTTMAVVSDVEGEERIEIHEGAPTAEITRFSDMDLGWIQVMKAAPRGRLLAVANHRCRLFVVDVDARRSTTVDESAHFLIRDLAWSPDGRWLAYAYRQSTHVQVIKLYNVETGESAVATPPLLTDRKPVFDPEGKYLYFISDRDLDPVYDRVHFDLGFPKGSKPFLVTLRKDVPNPFLPQPEPDAPGGEGPNGAAAGDRDGGAKGAGTDDKESEKEDEQRIEIDVDGIQDRILAFPLEDAIYATLDALPGKLLYTTLPIEGGRTRNLFATGAPPAKATLSAFDFKTGSSDVLISGITSFALSADRKTMIYRAGNKLRYLAAGEKPDEKSAQEGPGRKSGWIDLSRIKVSVVPPLEWRQMFREAWRMQRDNFWNADMSDVDWLAVYRRYEPLLDRVSSREEFSDLMWEMQGELGTSHAYEIGGDYREAPQYRQGFLGADLSFDADRKRWRFDRVLRGDVWDPEAGSPLAKPGVNVSDGESLLAVNGASVDGGRSPAELLVNQANSEVALTVGAAEGGEPRTVVIKTVASEFPVRYRDWVEKNRRRVHEATNGKVGYIHVPNMIAEGYAEFHRSFLPEIDRDGLIVDVRFNGGGHVSALLLEKLARRRVAYVTTRWFGVDPWPDDAPPRPIVALTNEQAGSDGDIFSHSFKLLGLGPLIGKRTWGGVIGIWPRQSLVDRTITTQPEFSFWFEDVGWRVENYGTDPDIEVEITPQDYGAGRDPQLDRAIQEAERIRSSHVPKTPSLDDRPSRSVPRLNG
ncbi:MAG: S41 family peptidase [bacterium]